jgi:hypothetical protein
VEADLPEQPACHAQVVQLAERILERFQAAREGPDAARVEASGKRFADVALPPCADAQLVQRGIARPAHARRLPQGFAVRFAQRAAAQGCDGTCRLDQAREAAGTQDAPRPCMGFLPRGAGTPQETLRRAPAFKPGGEDIPVARPAERPANPAVVCPQHIPGNERAQAAQADAQLVEVFGVGRAARVRRVVLDLHKRRSDGIGVTDGIRTRNNRNHNPGLYR